MSYQDLTQTEVSLNELEKDKQGDRFRRAQSLHGVQLPPLGCWVGRRYGQQLLVCY